MVQEQQRATPRIPVKESVMLRLPGEQARIPCVLDNISLGGARFATARQLEVGQQVELCVSSSEAEPEIVIRATILRAMAGNGADMFDYACWIGDVDNA